MTRTEKRPVVGIPASVRLLEFDLRFHGTGEQYLRAVREDVGATAFTIPGMADLDNAIELLELMDGLLLTGSFSNLHPSTYGEEVTTDLGFYDRARDGVTMPLIRAAIERGMPVFGLCRGMQEMTVAFGGSLHQVLHEVPGANDHRPDESLPLERHFDPAHEVTITPGGVLSRLIPEKRFITNTAHMQGVKQVPPALLIEAITDDGVIEAVSVKAARSFAVGVQFHPEWGTADNRLYSALFRSFREAVHSYAAERRRAAPAPVRRAAFPGGA